MLTILITFMIFGGPQNYKSEFIYYGTMIVGGIELGMELVWLGSFIYSNLVY